MKQRKCISLVVITQMLMQTCIVTCYELILGLAVPYRNHAQALCSKLVTAGVHKSQAVVYSDH